MSNDERIQELREKQAWIREKTEQLMAEVLKVLQIDLPLFVDRELKKAFVADPDFAEAMPDERIREIRRAARERGEAKARDIVERIRDLDLWLDGAKYAEGAKTLEDHHDLWRVVDEISMVVRELLKDYGFPKQYVDTVEIHYRQPRWFISGVLLTTTAEKYWQKMAEYNAVAQELEELDLKTRREALKRRWDSIS